MADIPLKNAVFLWSSGFDGHPEFAVVPRGSPTYYSKGYTYSGGACYTVWHDISQRGETHLLAKAMIDLWHIVAKYHVPADMVHVAMLAVPEYRAMLADDFMPREFHHEREW